MKIKNKVLLKIGIATFVMYLCIHYWASISGLLGKALSAAIPLLAGGVIAYIVNIIMSFFERHYFPKARNGFVIKSRRPFCLIMAVIIIFAVIVLIGRMIVPQLVDCVMVLVNKAPTAMQKLISLADEMEFIPDHFLDMLASMDWKSYIEQIVGTITTGVSSLVNILIDTVSSVFSSAVSILVAIIFAVYLLFGKEKLSNQCKRVMKQYIRPQWYERLLYIIGTLNDCFHRFIVGQCTEAVILGILCTIGMWIFKFPYAVMIGTLTAFTALIPIAGAYIGAFVGAFMMLTVSPITAVLFLVFIIVLQQLEGNIVYPRVVGSSIGLPGIWVLAAVTIGGGVMGVGGMLLAVPITAALYRLLREDLNKQQPVNVGTDTQDNNISKGPVT